MKQQDDKTPSNRGGGERRKKKGLDNLNLTGRNCGRGIVGDGWEIHNYVV